MKCKLASILFATLLLLMIPQAHARVYQASARHSWAYPPLTLAVAIDTDAHIWTAKWNGEPYLLDPPSIFVAFIIKFVDDMGFKKTYDMTDGVKNKGTITIEGYTNHDCWTETWCCWTYFFPLPVGFGLVTAELWIDLYIGHVPVSGGGWQYQLRGENLNIQSGS